MGAKRSRAKKGRIPARISGSMFYKYLACPHWLWFEAFGDLKKKAPQSKFSDMLLEMGVEHEKEVIMAEGLTPVKGKTIAVRAKATRKLMEQGVDRIYHGVLIDDEFVGEPDILEKHTDKASDLGPWYYVPVDIKSGERVTDSHKMQLSCYGELLARTQGLRPKEGYILTMSGVRISVVLADHHDEFHAAVDGIKKLFAGEMPAPHLSSSCKQSPWFKECKALAVRTDDIAQLYNVKKRVVQELRQHGIRTVHDVAKMDVGRTIPLSPMFKKPLLERMVLQAKSLISGKHVVRVGYSLPETSLEIFFDIEGDPLKQVEYLFGFWMREYGVLDPRLRGDDNGGAGMTVTDERFEFQIAEKPEDEGKMWESFLGWIERLPKEYAVYHYGTYELVRLNQMGEKYGRSRALDTFTSRLIDLNEIVKDKIVFPLHFYGIKDIGKYIGYARSGDIAGGGESVAFYEEWLEKGDRSQLDAIIEYNKDDVIATKFLKDWLAAESKRVFGG